jgi:hypothetical protein
VFSIKSLAETGGAPTATATPATTCYKHQTGGPSGAATPATPATDVAKVAAVAVAAGGPLRCAHEVIHEAGSSLEARQPKVEAQLQDSPGLQRAFDVSDMPPTACPGQPVTVVLAVRHGEQILSGEVLVPRERWHLAAFIATVEVSWGAS